LNADQLAFLLVSVFLAGLVGAANLVDRDRDERLRRGLLAVLVVINFLIVMTYGLLQVVMAYGPEPEDGDAIGKGQAWIALAGSVVLAALATALLSRSFRERIAGLFPSWKRAPGPSDVEEPVGDQAPAPGEFLTPQTGASAKPLFPQMLDYFTEDSVIVPRTAPDEQTERQPDTSAPPASGTRGFNPASYVHLVALLAAVYMLGTTLINFSIGGLEGIAETYEEEGISASELLINAFALLLVSVVGVGWGIRRNGAQVLRRLGLTMPTGEGLAVAVGVTIALFVFVAALSTIWINVVSEETYEEQTRASEALAESVNSVGMALLLATTAAVGEEIAFRGALQPVFGFWPTSIFFALTHAQYTLTPAWLIILGVALGFGWLRLRYNTTVAILAHFLYNFIPLAVTVSVPEEVGAWLLRLF
jgi:hypothetical protein